MKKITLMLIVISAVLKSQSPKINVWRVSGPVCSEDSVKVDFKIINPVNSTITTVFFDLKTANNYTIAWQGNYQDLYNCHKETWYPLASTDSCYYKWFKVPKMIGAGTATVLTPFAITVPGPEVTFSIYPIPPVVFSIKKLICKGESFTFNPTGSTSYTFPAGQTVSPLTTTDYTIIAKLNSCVTTETVELTVNNCTGIAEYQEQDIKPVYYSMTGEVVEIRYNELIIEQAGNVRRKIIIIQK